ncbi:hypothetical protein [Asanoa ferruginea]|nr:hypothetical protein [Asanoa ferruginea]
MSEDHSGPAVVAFGAGEPTTGRLRANPFGAWVARVGRDRLLAAIVAVLAAAAGFISLVTQWYSIAVPAGDVSPEEGGSVGQTLTFTVGDVGTFGTGYVLGVLTLVVACALAFFGPPALRPVLRVGGLGLAGGLVAVLVALSVSFGHSIERNYFGANIDLDTTRHAGLTGAYAAVLLAGAALFLIGRHRFVPTPTEAPPVAVAPDSVWQAPRPYRSDETAAEVAAAAPLDLTVQPARPFAHPDGDDGRAR